MTEQNSTIPRYPLGQKQPDTIRSRTGLSLADISLDAVRDGQVASDDLTIHAETLQMQADIAEGAGYEEVAESLRRAAELVDVPNDRLLEIYEALRPHRSTYQELIALSEELQAEYGASENAHFIRQAAEAYRDTGLVRAEPNLSAG